VVELMANLFLNSLILSIFIIFILMLTPLFKGYSRRWRYIAFLIIGIKLLLPFSFIPKDIGIHIPIRQIEKSYISDKKIDNLSDVSDIINPFQTDDSSNNYISDETDDLSFNSVLNNAVMTRVENSSKPEQKKVSEQEVPKEPGFVDNLIVQINNYGIKLVLPLALILWVIVSILLLLVYFIIYSYHKRTIKHWSEPVEKPELLQIFNEEKEALGIKHQIAFLHCKKINTPMAVGILHPSILIPYMDDYSGLRYILRHELVHQSHHDMYTKLFYVVIKSVQWFNPLVRLMVRYAYDDIELLCDDEVVKSLEKKQRIQYNESILNIVRRQCEYEDARNIVFSFGLIQEKNDLKERMLNIMYSTGKKKGYWFAIVLSVLILSSASIIAFANVDNSRSNNNINNTNTKIVNEKELAVQKLKTAMEDKNLSVILSSALDVERTELTINNKYWAAVSNTVARMTWVNSKIVDMTDTHFIVKESDINQIGNVLATTPLTEDTIPEDFGIQYKDGKYYFAAGDPGNTQYVFECYDINNNNEMVINGTIKYTDYTKEVPYEYAAYTFAITLRNKPDTFYEYQIKTLNLTETDEFKQIQNENERDSKEKQDKKIQIVKQWQKDINEEAFGDLLISILFATKEEIFPGNNYKAHPKYPFWETVILWGNYVYSKNKTTKIEWPQIEEVDNNYLSVKKSDVDIIAESFFNKSFSAKTIPEGYNITYDNTKEIYIIPKKFTPEMTKGTFKELEYSYYENSNEVAFTYGYVDNENGQFEHNTDGTKYIITVRSTSKNPYFNWVLRDIFRQ